MEITTKSVDLDYQTKKHVTVIKSNPCLKPLDFQGLTERSNLLQYLQDPNNALCNGSPFDNLEMFWKDGFWIVRMSAVVLIE